MAVHRIRNKHSVKGCRLGQFGGTLLNLIFKFGNKLLTRCLNFGVLFVVLRLHLCLFCGVKAILVLMLQNRGVDNITHQYIDKHVV